jgi:hypothetical protein
MGLSRKRQRELKRLKNHAEAVLHDQREVLEHAAHVVRSASRQAARYTREEVSPRVRDTLEHRVRPALASGASATRSAAHQTRDKFVDDVMPAVSSALGTALAALEVARSPQVRDAITNIANNTRGARLSKASGAASTGGPGKYILLGLGIVAVAGVAYAAWQTLRADDDLWIDDDADTDAQALEDDFV